MFITVVTQKEHNCINSTNKGTVYMYFLCEFGLCYMYYVLIEQVQAGKVVHIIL